MSEMWRVIDTGLRAAAQNIALDRALLEARHAEEIPSTLRFSRYAPCVLMASRQSAGHEVHLDYCNASGIAVQRRLTGGDAAFCDGAQLGWSLYLHQRDVASFDMRAVARRICHAAAGALNTSGMNACHRAPHDIEVDGRKIGAAGGVFEGNALLYQGILHLELCLPPLLLALRTPASGVARHAAAAAHERITDVRTVLGECPDARLIKDRLVAAFESEFEVEFHDADLSLSEHARYERALAEIDTADWIHLVDRPASEVVAVAAEQTCAAGILRADVLYDRARSRIKQVWFTGGLTPLTTLPAAGLESALCDSAIERLERNVRAFFSVEETRGCAWAAADFISVMRRALQLPLIVSGYTEKPSS